MPFPATKAKVSSHSLRFHHFRSSLSHRYEYVVHHSRLDLNISRRSFASKESTLPSDVGYYFDEEPAPKPQKPPKLSPNRGRNQNQPLSSAENQQPPQPKNKFVGFEKAEPREIKPPPPPPPPPKPKVISYPHNVPARQLADLLGIRLVSLLKIMIQIGISPKTSSDALSDDVVELICQEHGVRAVKQEYHEIKRRSYSKDERQDLPKRAPIVAIMGHVNHGKTSILDAFRNSNRTAGEAGGITQDVAAFQVNTKNGTITFLDTPGHEAFAAMRSRGAKVADLAVLVVAADEGIKAQTLEALRSIREAHIPMIVAINKVDKKGVDVKKVQQQLLRQEVALDGMGGDVLHVEVSALQKIGLDELAEAILLQAEIEDLKGNPTGPGFATVIESRVDKHKGMVISAIVEDGVIQVGSHVVAGGTYGRVKQLLSDSGKPLTEAGPSTPVQIIGFNQGELPMPGEELLVGANENEVKSKAHRSVVGNTSAIAKPLAGGKGGKTEAQLLAEEEEKSGVEYLKVYLKAESAGALQALEDALIAIPYQDEVKVKVIGKGIGDLSDKEIEFVTENEATIIAFAVKCVVKSKDKTKKKNFDLVSGDVIFTLVDEIRKRLEDRLKPSVIPQVMGACTVLQLFPVDIDKKEVIVAGSKVTAGVIARKYLTRVKRSDVVVFEGNLASIKHFKQNVDEVKKDMECGLHIADFNGIMEGDTIECYKLVEHKRNLGEPLMVPAGYQHPKK